MQPEQPNNIQQPQQPQAPAAPPQQSMQPAQPAVQPAAPAKVPFYRSYWVFAAIYLILPPIIGLIILFSGDIYRKQKDGTVAAIGTREKVTLTVVAMLLWIFLIFRNFTTS